MALTQQAVRARLSTGTDLSDEPEVGRLLGATGRLRLNGRALDIAVAAKDAAVCGVGGLVASA